jgi:phosphoserine phosphatase RsbU/P
MMDLGGRRCMLLQEGECNKKSANQAEAWQASDLLWSLVNNAADGIIAIDENGSIILTNLAAERLFGYHRQEMVGQNIGMLMPEPYRSEHDHYLHNYLATGQKRIIGQGREVSGRRKDGSVFPMHLSVAEIQRGQRRFFAGIVHDLSEHKQKEEQLLWLFHVLEQSPVAVTITDTEGNIKYVNAKFTQLTGYRREEVLGENPRLLQSGRTSLEEYQHLWKTISSGEEWRGEIQDQRKGGEIYWVREHISSIKNTQGEITHFVAIAEDITERKQIEQALQESEERFRQIAKMTGEWIWEQDPGGHYIYCSAAVKEILGYEPKQMISRSYREFLIPDNQEGQLGKVAENLSSQEKFFRVINHYRHQDGHEVFTESTGEPIFDEQGQLLKWRGVDRDITKRLQAQELIRRTQVRLAVARNELRLARQIQESLLPAEPLILPEIQVVGCCLPASQVGGDYFDYYHRPDHKVDVAIADVSGHSVGPALFMVETRSALKTQLRSQYTAADTLAILNESLYEDLNRADHFITMFYLQYHTVTGEINYASAGHNPPLLLRCGEAHCAPLDADGMIFGVKKEIAFEEKRTFLKKGDIVFLYTDGVIEVENEEEELFGVERLCQLLTAHAHLTPPRLIKVIIKKLKRFCRKKAFNDDVTMVVLKVM